MEVVNMFAGNPLLAGKRSHMTPQSLHDLLNDETVKAKGGALLLPVCDSKVLIVSSRTADGSASWSLAWQPLQIFGTKVPISLSSMSEGEENMQGDDKGELKFSREYDKLVYLGEMDGTPSFAIDLSWFSHEGRGKVERVAALFSTSERYPQFVDLRTLMTATDWDKKQTMEELSIAGYSRAITEWHKTAQYCGRCGTKTVPIEAGVRRQCSDPACKLKTYPRTDPVVIMLIIDKERDKALLGRQARFPTRMWSCLAGFIEAGESLEEAVRRETFEEAGIVVGEIVYHSSQPWPVGPPGMPSQLMVGFLAYAKTFDIHMDGVELEDVQWYTREQVKQAMTYTDYKDQQNAAILKIAQTSLGGEWKDSRDAPAQETTLPFIPGPYAIAHQLIATWVNQGPEVVLSKV